MINKRHIKLMIKKEVVILFILLVIPLINAGTFSSCEVYGNCKTTTSTTSTNYSLVNVNNSQYLQGYTPFNLPYLTSFTESDPLALQAINGNLSNWLSTYNLTYENKADYQFTSNNFNGSGNFTTSGLFAVTSTASNAFTIGNGATGSVKVGDASFSKTSGSGWNFGGGSLKGISTIEMGLGGSYGSFTTDGSVGSPKGFKWFGATGGTNALRMIIDIQGNVTIYNNFTTNGTTNLKNTIINGTLNSTNTINTQTNFSVNNVQGITQSFNMTNGSSITCLMNFSGGILTSSTC